MKAGPPPALYARLMLTDDPLRIYAELLRRAPHNLMSPRGLAELEERHFPECRRLAGSLPFVATRRQRLLDVGSGGGLPGLVIAIERSDLDVHLLEATAKKVDFLRQTCERLDLPVQVHHGRAEELLRSSLGGTFDVVTARAVAPLDRLLTWSIPFLRPRGLLYAVKGDRWREEVDAASATLRRLGASIVATPDDDAIESGVRSVIVMRNDGMGSG